ncbi:hypothetical protein DFQ28_002936 [Apophysomyces sp. BC1034]|nr:hypothetical protein DFQ30_009684 [Apophysomyces sp. BC1015]KAG0180662.1 hypothetical protein DFQ29_000222 [Apophysomyces sp. BC1021]KAG0194861.1 hypothetical protein DFQ28_002936 [Apophysomyces sp. BC1034]
MNSNKATTSPGIDSSGAKIRKKPGRKPNPASPSQRKAQNREAQRAFRERKERHLRDLEKSLQQIQDQRDQLQLQNERLQTANELLRSENWYMKGIVLSLQLVCFQYNLVIPQHTPFIHDQALAVMAQSIGPSPSRAYIHANMRNKLAHDLVISDNSAIQDPQHNHHAGEKDTVSAKTGQERPRENRKKAEEEEEEEEASDMDEDSDNDNNDDDVIVPVMLRPCEPLRPRPAQPSSLLSSNLTVVQSLCFQSRQQFKVPYNNQPTLLQLMIPHDPRIDLIPTPHMRDRMILFRDQFDLNDCFQCLLGHAIFHGGDPTVAANWQIPAEFFEKFWFLTTDYDPRRKSAANSHRLTKSDLTTPCTFSDLSMHFGSQLLKFGTSPPPKAADVSSTSSLSSSSLSDLANSPSLSCDQLDYDAFLADLVHMD